MNHQRSLYKKILQLIDFSMAFDSIHRRKMKEIRLPCGLSKQTVITTMMLYKNLKAMDHSPYRDIDFFNIVTGVLQGDTLEPYLFIICLDYVLWISINLIKENGFRLKKKGKKQTISFRNCDRWRLCRWYSAFWKYTCSSQIPATYPAADIGLNVNTNRIEYMCFKWDGAISTMWWTSEINSQVYVPQQQCLINWKWR